MTSLIIYNVFETEKDNNFIQRTNEEGNSRYKEQIEDSKYLQNVDNEYYYNDDQHNIDYYPDEQEDISYDDLQPDDPQNEGKVII